MFSHIKDHMLQKIWQLEQLELLIQSVSRATKMSSFGEKTNNFGENHPMTASSTIQKVEKCFLKLFLFLRYLNFSPAVFGHVGKWLDRKANVNFEIYYVTDWEKHLK